MSAENKADSYHKTPFKLENKELYKQWREKKLDNYPKELSDLVVEIDDPRNLSKSEHQKILTICQQTNMVLYAAKTGNDADPEIPLSMGKSFGCYELDHNWLADESGLTSLTVSEDGARKNFIPYGNKAINWHTDGYYNPQDKQIHALNLHCVMPAPVGGENQLMDHEVAYILLRDENPDYIRALMADDVMTIPARMKKDGTIARAEEVGPVFSVVPETGDLHMRYTIRKKHVVWKNDSFTLEALQRLESILEGPSAYIFKGKLESGMGLISNNILHDRSAFEDSDTQKRLIYRSRFYDRLAGTSISRDNA
ncbi:MAG: TauD/TfdA family dioxygenase [gamma proteobacterium symbiont of Taylorina sp.]|nr:TauD/TfdA family dioxygenase [gamma proteobacterium symbiont of Taylorina sp.]